MNFKKLRKDISRFFSWVGLNCCSLLINIIPGCLLYNFAAGFAQIGYLVAHRQRRIALENLSIAFGQNKSRKEIKKLARDCFTFMAKSGLELVYLIERPWLLRQRVQLTGKEHLDNALSKGRGVILVSAHFGNFPLTMGRLSLEGYQIGGIIRHMRDWRTEKLFLAKRNQLKLKTIYSQPRKACVDTAIRSLKNNESLFILLDQNFGTGGVFVDFFGKKAATATGPVVLAQRTKATILPCFIIRNDNNTHQIIFEPALNLETGKTIQETIIINIQKLTNIIESYVRRYPTQWSWIHRRWKSQIKIS